LSNNKVFKNNQVNVGMPFQIRAPITYQPPVRKSNLNFKIDLNQPDEMDDIDYKAIGDEIVNKSKTEADLIIREALLEAKEIISKASLDMEELRNKVLDESQKEGYSQGITTAKYEYEQLIDEAQDIKEQAGVEYKKILDSLETDAVSTILDIAKKVISQELKCKENILLLVQEAFEKCSKDHNAVLKLCTQDYDYVNENKDKLISMLQRSEEIEIKKDLSLTDGGCIIDTPYGSIDASANTKLDKIENDFIGILDEKMN
jgi:flagellar assembly protein FliH